MDVRIRLALTAVSAALVLAAFLISTRVRLNVHFTTTTKQHPPRPDGSNQMRVGIKASKFREQTLTANEPLMSLLTRDHELVALFKETVDPGSLQLTDTSIIAIYESSLYERLFHGSEAPMNVIIAKETIFPCLGYAMLGNNDLYDRLDCLSLDEHIVDDSYDQLDTKSKIDYPESLLYARTTNLVWASSQNSGQLVQVELEFMPLKKKMIDRHIDAMLQDNGFTRSQLISDAGGAENLQQFGFFVNGTLGLNGIDWDACSPDGTGKLVQLICSGDLFFMVNTRNKPYEQGTGSRSRGYFNLGQYNETLTIPSLVEKLDYYLDQGIKNRGLLISQPDFECKVVGNDSLTALKSNITLILKNSFPYLTLKQQVTTLDGMLDIASKVKQQRAQDSSERPSEYTSFFGLDFESKLADVSRITYLKAINHSAHASGQAPQSETKKSSGTRQERIFAPIDILSSSSSEDDNDIGDEDEEGDDQYKLPTWFEGWSENVVDNLLNTTISVNFSSIWNSRVKQHKLVIYKLLSDGRRHERLPADDQVNSTKREARDILVEFLIDDRKNVDLTMISMQVAKNWREVLLKALNLDTPSGRKEAIDKLRLSRESHKQPAIKRGHGGSGESAPAVLFEHKFSIVDNEYLMQERLQRCDEDKHLASASIRSMISCGHDSRGEERLEDDNNTADDEGGYVRQLYLSMKNPSGSTEIHCYPYKRQTILNRIGSSLRELNEANSTSSNNYSNHQRHQELANQLDGFVKDYRKLGFYCDTQLKLKQLSLRLGFSWDTVLAVNETTGKQRDKLEGGGGKTLLDHYNWLLESVLLGDNRLSDGVFIDSYFTAEILGPFWMREIMSEQLSIQQNYLYKKTFPYVSYRISTQSIPDDDPYLFTMSGTIDQTCTERVAPPVQYNIGDNIAGPNSILEGSEELYKLILINDGFDQTYCTSYNTTYKFGGCLDALNLGYFNYTRDIMHRPRGIEIDSSSIRLTDLKLWMFGYGFKHDEFYRHISRWHSLDYDAKKIDYNLDVLQTSKPGEPWITLNINPKKDLLFDLVRRLTKKLRLKKQGKANSIIIRAFDKHG